MIKKRVTLILGAGTSVPYHFPLGAELKAKIVEQILEPQKDKQFFLPKFLTDLGHSKEEQQEFAIKLRDSYFMSVDAFLEEWKKYTLLGKRAIAANIIKNEEYDALMTPRGGNWYQYLLSLMGNRDDFLLNQLQIVTFNYDRSLEYFMYYTLNASFDMSEDEIVNSIRRIPIVHVYGQLGLPKFIKPDGRDYKNELNINALEMYAKEISIIHENLGITPALQEAHELIRKSELLVFLGSGYHRKNIERLMLRENFTGEKVVCAFFGKESGEIERDLEIMHANTITAGGKIPIEHYHHRGGTLGFLKDTNYLK